MVEQFLAHLQKDSNDWNTRAVFADWYEENGDLPRAEALRWMIRNKKRPYHNAWWDSDRNTDTYEDTRSDIPPVLFYKLKNHVNKEDDTPTIRTYYPGKAEMALIDAYVKAVELGWVPYDVT